MAVMILAAPINPDNTAHGYNWTFAYPMLLFIVVALVLYYLFGRPHRRVPPRPISATAGSRRPDPRAARAASVAGGLGVAAGGGTTESVAEPHGAQPAASSEGDSTAGGTAHGATATGDIAAGGAVADDTGADDTGAQE